DDPLFVLVEAAMADQPLPRKLECEACLARGFVGPPGPEPPLGIPEGIGIGNPGELAGDGEIVEQAREARRVARQRLTQRQATGFERHIHLGLSSSSLTSSRSPVPKGS